MKPNQAYEWLMGDCGTVVCTYDLVGHAKNSHGSFRVNFVKRKAPRAGLPWTVLRLLRDHPHHVQALVRATPFVVVPADELDEGLVECDAGIGVEDRGTCVAAEVGDRKSVV